MAEIGAMRFVAVRVSFMEVITARAVSVAAVPTDDWFDAIRLPAAAALLAVLLVVRLHTNNISTQPSLVSRYEKKINLHSISDG